MLKHELDADPGHDPGSIQAQLHALAVEHVLPEAALVACTLRVEESGPALRALVGRAADGAALTDDEARLLFRGLYVLGAARDAQSFGPLLRLLRLPSEELEFLLGDAITEGLSRIVAGVFDGRAELLFEAVADRSKDEYVRDALLGAATFLTWEGRIDLDRMRRFLERFDAEHLADDRDFAWIGWLQAIALLGLRELEPRVEAAWRQGRILKGVMEPRHFEEDLAEAERGPRDIDRFKRAHLGYIDDVVQALAWTRPVEKVTHPDPIWVNNGPAPPAVNPWRHVGRNDPCPCGSGKKAKKCCLG